MVRLTITPAILTATREAQRNGLDLSRITEAPEPSLDNPSIGDPISHGQIIALSKLLRHVNVEPEEPPQPMASYHLDDLLRGARLYHEPPKRKAEPSSEYKALMARLRREEETRAYERMINPPAPSETFVQRYPTSSNAKLFSISTQAETEEADEVTYADINRQMALIINILISIVACSVAIWLAARHWSTPKRLGLSMGGSGIIGVAEAVVYAGYVRRLKEAREKGKKQVEIKEIIKTWVIGGEEKEPSQGIPRPIVSKKPVDDSIRKRRNQNGSSDFPGPV